MSSTHASPTDGKTSVPPRPPVSLTELLGLLANAADNAEATIAQITVTASSGDVYIEMATAADVTNFVKDLKANREEGAKVDMRDHPDIGVYVTSYDGTYLGWSLYVQHVHRTPTIQEGTTPA